MTLTQDDLALLRRIYKRMRPPQVENLVYLTPAGRLRLQAGEDEEKERDAALLAGLIARITYGQEAE